MLIPTLAKGKSATADTKERRPKESRRAEELGEGFVHQFVHHIDWLKSRNSQPLDRVLRHLVRSENMEDAVPLQTFQAKIRSPK
eukprot:594640-Amphidinium_carterae.1